MDLRRHPLLLLGSCGLAAVAVGMPSACLVPIAPVPGQGVDAAAETSAPETGSGSGSGSSSGSDSGSTSGSGGDSGGGGDSGSGSGGGGDASSGSGSSSGSDAGCSPSLATDPMNCGRCGHVCDTGTCSGGTCTPRTLHVGSGTVSDLRVVGSQLFWIEGLAGLYACTLPDCSSVTTVVSGTTLAGFAVAGSTAFVVEGVSTNGVVRAYAIDGSGTTGDLTAPLQGLRGPMDVDASNVFYTARDSMGTPFFGYLPQSSSSASGTDITTYISSFQVQMRVATEGVSEYAYWTDGSNLIRSPTGNSSMPTTLATGNGTAGLAVDSQYVFWTASGDGKVLRCDATAGDCSSATTILQSQASPSRVAVDANGIAWTDAASGTSGTVSECTYPDCASPLLLAQGQASPSELAMVASYVYWATGSTIWRVPR